MALKESFEVVDPEQLKLSWSDYDSIPTDADKRRAIRAKLNDYGFVINMESITKQALDDVSDPGEAEDGEEEPQGEMPDRINAMGIMDGVVFVRAFYDGTSKTGAIKNGHAVVFDTVTGNSVTGINSDWTADEYKIVGVALKDYSSVTSVDKPGTIPIRLTPPLDNIEQARIAITTHDPDTTYPAYSETLRMFPIAFWNNGSFNETTGTRSGSSSGYKAKAYNLQPACFVPEGQEFLTWQINGRWYFNWTPVQILEIALTEDLLPGGSANFTSSGLPSVPTGMKVFAVAIKPGYKFASGSNGIALRSGNRYIAVKFFNCPVPQ